MLYRHVVGKISSEFRGFSRVFVHFAGFRGLLEIRGSATARNIRSPVQGKLQRHPSKVITFRSYKNFDCDKFARDLAEAPWHVGEILDDLDHQVHHWNTLLILVMRIFPERK